MCSECQVGNIQLNEVRDEWRKQKRYYGLLTKGPGTTACIGMVNGNRCLKLIHTEIGGCGVAYVCRNGMNYKECDLECDNWMCFDCHMLIMGNGRKRVRRS